MEKTKLLKYMQSIVVIPFMAMMIPISPLSLSMPSLTTEITGKSTATSFIHEAQLQAQQINSYFEQHDLPLAGYGNIFVQYAYEYDIPWNLAAAIAMRESTGGKFMFKKNNPFGWGKKEFTSLEEAIRIVSWNLGGHNPNTARYYKDKSIDELLRYYNPPHVVQYYSNQVQRIMNDMAAMPHEAKFAQK